MKKEKLIYVVLLINKKDKYDYLYTYSFNTNINPMYDDLRCIRKEEIDVVRSIEEIQNEDYTTDDIEIYETRLREIKGEYEVISMELLDHLDQINSELLKNDAELQIESLLDNLGITKYKLNEYTEIKKRIIRDNKLNSLGI
jgi:hypothetical protein